jgi:hypothetical protein
VELKQIITKLTYRIEEKPEGGFIAHASDATLPALEAPTRTELQQKIQANISAALAAQFPGLKLPTENEQLKFDFHIEAKPGGGFIIRSHDPDAATVEGASHEEIEHPVAEKLANTLGKYIFPELSQAISQALAKQGGSGDIKVFVNRKTFSVGAGSKTARFGNSQNAQLDAPIQVSEANRILSPPDNSPITPEDSNSSKVFRFLLALLVVIAILYFYLHH